MKLSQFEFELPEELISKYPADHRDESRLMVVNRKEGTIEHKLFKDVIDYFEEGDVMMLNDTKVFPARMYGNKEKTGARIEVFLLRELNAENRLWDVLVDPARKIRIGNKLFFGEDGPIRKLIDPFVSQSIALEKMSDVMPSNLLLGGRGGVTKTGAAVYSDTDSDQDKFMKSLGHIFRGVRPTFIDTGDISTPSPASLYCFA